MTDFHHTPVFCFVLDDVDFTPPLVPPQHEWRNWGTLSPYSKKKSFSKDRKRASSYSFHSCLAQAGAGLVSVKITTPLLVRSLWVNTGQEFSLQVRAI